MPRKPDAPLFVGIKGHVIALDRATGTERWRTKLEGVRMRAHDFVHLHRDRDHLYASFSGEVFCLDPATGALRWHNQLKGLGTGVTSLLSEAEPRAGDRGGAPASLFAEQKRRDDARRSAAAS